MKRTFFAIKVCDEAKVLLKNILLNFPELRQKIKIANPDNPHITLKFLADTKVCDIENIDEKIQTKLENLKRFSFQYESTGVFPNSSRARVFFIRINKGLKNLQLLHNLIEQNIYVIVYGKDYKDFIPHLTLGRRKSKRINKIEVMNFLNYKFKPVINYVDEIIWFESILQSGGAIHKPIKKYKLK